ncbi:hypothetical protein ACIBBG_26840 [Micromonospora chersina]|uniref:hypothetical protein n=1 Tax=Micromonospora chersina TaxID=47854 RepID=UPI0037AD933A
MSNDDLTECLTCGAMVDRMAKHRRWHEALERMVPGLTAELERLDRRSSTPPPAPQNAPNPDRGFGGF